MNILKDGTKVFYTNENLEITVGEIWWNDSDDSDSIEDTNYRIVPLSEKHLEIWSNVSILLHPMDFTVISSSNPRVAGNVFLSRRIIPIPTGKDNEGADIKRDEFFLILEAKEDEYKVQNLSLGDEQHWFVINDMEFDYLTKGDCYKNRQKLINN